MASQSVPEYGLRIWSEIWPQNRPQPAAHETMPKHGPGPQIGAEAWGWAPNRAQNMASKSAPKCGPRFNTKIQHSKRIQNMALDSIPKKTPTCSAKIRTAWGRTRYPTICGRAHILRSNYDTADTQHGPSLCSSKSGATCRDLADACVNECAMLFTNEQRGWCSVYVWPHQLLVGSLARGASAEILPGTVWAGGGGDRALRCLRRPCALGSIHLLRPALAARLLLLLRCHAATERFALHLSSLTRT